MEIVLYTKNQQVNLFFKKCVEKAGHNYSCAHTLAEVIRLIRGKAPDFVFSDTREICFNGFNLVNHLKFNEANFIYIDLGTFILGECDEIPEQPIFDAFYLPEGKTEKAVTSEIKEIIKKYEFFVKILQYNTAENPPENISENQNDKQGDKEPIFLNQQKLQHHHILVLQYFFKNPDEKISSQKLMEKLWGKSKSENTKKEEHQSTLYSYISQIKKIIENLDIGLNIQRSGKGFYTFSFD